MARAAILPGAVPIQLGEPLRSWVLDPDLAKYRVTDPRAIVNAAADTIAGGLPDDIRADYLDCYDGDRFVESMRYVRRYPEELPVPIANAEFLDRRLPASRLATIDAGHFVGGGSNRVRLDRRRLDHGPLAMTGRRRYVTNCCPPSMS